MQNFDQFGGGHFVRVEPVGSGGSTLYGFYAGGGGGGLYNPQSGQKTLPDPVLVAGARDVSDPTRGGGGIKVLGLIPISDRFIYGGAGKWESLIPVWGNFRNALYAQSRGDSSLAFGYSVLAGLDALLLAFGAAKLATSTAGVLGRGLAEAGANLAWLTNAEEFASAFRQGWKLAPREGEYLGSLFGSLQKNWDRAALAFTYARSAGISSYEEMMAELASGASSRTGATFGSSLTNDYRATFFAAHPELEGQVVVHHAVPQRTLILYPSEVTESQIHSLENLRGIPNEINSELHLRQIGNEWRQFYKENPNATQAQLLQKATEIDAKYGLQFKPPI